MLNKKIIFQIAKKEFQTYFNTSTGYILIVPFIFISFFLYFRSALLSNQATLRPFFDLLPYMLLLLAPAIAMRTFAQEQKNKTLELMYAHPISETEIVLGKFLGSLVFYIVFLIATLSLPITLLLFSNPDPGIIIAQYLGAVFVGGGFLSIGIAAATITGAQVSSFLLAASISFGFILIGLEIVLLSLPKFVNRFVTELAILPHMTNISRGVLDMRDILYFLTLIGVFLTIAVIKLSQRMTVENPARRNRLNIALSLIVGIGIVTNILMNSYPIRLDLTQSKLFTLSKGTKQTITNLPDIVTLSLYTSGNLPGPEQVKVREVNDLLVDYHRIGKGKILTVSRHPDTNEEDLKLAKDQGIQEVQFQSLANNSFAVQAGFHGLSIQYGEKVEAIPYIQSVESLEYEITRKIRKMTSDNLPKLAIYTQSSSQYEQPKSINVLRGNIDTQYEVEDILLDESDTNISAKAVLVYGLTQPISATASAKITDFIDNGGNAVLLIDNHSINPQSGSAVPFATGLESILSDLGIETQKNIVYDVQLNETVTMGDGRINYLVPYPFWIKSIPAKSDSKIIDGIRSVSMAWPNSFNLVENEFSKTTSLLETGPGGGSQTGTYTISPNLIKPGTLPASGRQIVAVSAERENSKIVVAGDSDFITDQFTNGNPDNLNFITNAIDWVAGDDEIASISRKIGGNPVFEFNDAKQAQTVQYINIFLPVVLVSGFGIWWLRRRRLLSQRSYKVIN